MGTGSGLGDKRARGPGTGNANIIPEWERWKIEYQASTMGEYMAILEFFDIYLGSVSQISNQILMFRVQITMHKNNGYILNFTLCQFL